MKSDLHPRSIEIIAQSTFERACELAIAQEAPDPRVVQGIHAELYEYMVGFVTEEKGESSWAGDLVKDTFGGEVVEDRRQTRTQGQQRSQSNGGVQARGTGTQIKVFNRLLDPRGGQNDRGKPNVMPNPSWLEEAVLAAGIKEVWDNRKDHPAFGGPAANRKRPWFRERDPIDENDAKAFWPPKDHEDADAKYVHPLFANSAPSGVDDEEPF